MVVMNDAEGGRSILQSNILLKLKSLPPHIQYIYTCTQYALIPHICQIWHTTALFRPVKYTKKRVNSRQNRQYWPKQAKICCSLCQKVHLLEKNRTTTYTFINTAYSTPCLRFHSCGSKKFSEANPSSGRTSLVPSISVSTNFSDICLILSILTQYAYFGLLGRPQLKVSFITLQSK